MPPQNVSHGSFFSLSLSAKIIKYTKMPAGCRGSSRRHIVGRHIVGGGSAASNYVLRGADRTHSPPPPRYATAPILSLICRVTRSASSAVITRSSMLVCLVGSCTGCERPLSAINCSNLLPGAGVSCCMQ